LTNKRSPVFFHSAYLADADRALLTATWTALEEAELQDVLERIGLDILAGSRCCEILDEAGVFRPYVELLLREVLAIATTPGSSTTQRRARARAAIHDAGF
jgi:hypothetical protein